MKLLVRRFLMILFTTISLVTVSGCKKDDPSVLKVFVRNYSGNEFVPLARVIITADVDSNEGENYYGDTLVTNYSGYTEFNLDAYFEEAGKKVSTGYFDILVKKDGKEVEERIKCRKTITNVSTIYLDL